MLQFSNLTLGYNRHPVVHHLSAQIKAGDFIALVGPNGAGKSTLMKAILGLVPAIEGSLTLNGISRKDISYLPQASSVDRQFPLTVKQFVQTGLWAEYGASKSFAKKDAHQITNALERVGLKGFENRSLEALSGGQFQRLLFARKLMQQAPLILLDEPFTGVDEQTIEDLMAILNELNQQGATIVAVIHNVHLVRRYFPKTLLLSRELIGFGNTVDVLTEKNLYRAANIGFGDDIPADICQEHNHD